MGFDVRMAAREAQCDLASFHLLKYAAQVDGFLFTAKNSGTHWLRCMLSAAIAHHLGRPPPPRSSGPSSNIYIGHPKQAPAYPEAPRIGSSHTIPSRLSLLPYRLGLMRLPPTVVLARHIPEALLSYYVKWNVEAELGSLSDFVRRPSPGKRGVDDVWWFVRFFNRWGAIARMDPERVLVVRYEQLLTDPAPLIRKIWAHWGVTLSEADVAAGIEAGSRERVKAMLDPALGETIIPDQAERENTRLSPHDRALLWRIMADHLRYSLWPTSAQSEPNWPLTARPAIQDGGLVLNP
jgi:hypothetical protein